jgi:catechol 2,3-dioxygenase-like lactoylglutathione lyase family enzyme
MFKRLHHVALHVTDVPRAVKFYTEELGFKEMILDPVTKAKGYPNVFLQLGEALLEISRRDQVEAMSGFHLCLQPDDFDAAYTKLQASGLPVVVSARPVNQKKGPHEVGFQRAVFSGPHGELIEIRG